MRGGAQSDPAAIAQALGDRMAGAKKESQKKVGASEPEAQPVASGTGLRLKELTDRVSQGRTAAGRKTAREVVEAVLAEIGAALDQGEAVNLAGLGKFKEVKRAKKSGGTVLTLKLKRTSPGKLKEAKEGVAEDGAPG